MKVLKSICKVEMNPKMDRKRWVVILNDFDPDSVGETTVCGMPYRAEEVPVGTIFETTVRIPE